MGGGEVGEPFPEGKEGKLTREEEDRGLKGGHTAFAVPKVASGRPLGALAIRVHSSGGMLGARTPPASSSLRSP